MNTSSNDPNYPERLKKIVNSLEPTADIIQTSLEIENKQAYLLFLKSVVDHKSLQEMVIKPFFELSSNDHFKSYIESLPITEKPKNEDELLLQLSQGYAVITILEQYYLLEIRNVANTEVLDAKLEPTIHGPQKGLSESIEVNINLIRQRFHQPDLIVESSQMNDASNRSIAILYQKDKVSAKLLKKVKSRLDLEGIELIHSGNDLSFYMNNQKASLFPITLPSDRPDRLIHNITAGKIVILVDGSPTAIIAPIVFFDFMLSMEDNYHSFWITTFTLLLRYSGMFTCILLPSVYVAVTSFTPDVLRTELALTVAASRIGVPYPSFIEVLLMISFIELLTEASMRLPTAISSTATTVGGLILGTAVVEAALASNIMIIIVALVAISTFVIPINEMNFAIRLTRFILLIYTTIFGLAGLVTGFIGLILLLSNKDSFGEHYLRIFWKGRHEEVGADK